MQFASPSRRALGLLAASAIGMSTAVLAVTGVASAAPTPTFSFSSSTATATVPTGICAIDVDVIGGAGGDGSSALGADAGHLTATGIDVAAGDVLHLYVGGAGSDAAGSVPGMGGLNADPADGDDDFDGLDGDTDSTDYSGGGGAASSIVLDGAVIASAFGGDGGDSGLVGDDGLGGGYGSNDADTDDSFSTSATSSAAAGISGTGVPCVADAPYLNFVDAGDGSLTVNFVAPTDDNGIAVTGYEVTTNGGSTWAALATTTAEGRTSGTVTGLVNETAYNVGVRAVGGTGDALKGEPSQFQSATPYQPLAAPIITSLTTGPSQVTLTWTASAGVVRGYDVGWHRGESGNSGCATASTVFTCTFTVPAGTGYEVSVRAIDMNDRPGVGAFQSAVTVPGPAVPSSIPTKDDGDITGPAGPISTITAGQALTLNGAGFAPNSTVQLTVFSAPTSLGTVVTDGTGSFSVQVTVPAGLANGTHHLVATGINPDGTTRNLIVTVTVSGGTATLASTGFDAAVPLTGGALALLAGGGLLVGARRRSSN